MVGVPLPPSGVGVQASGPLHHSLLCGQNTHFVIYMEHAGYTS